jgi:hypothetical protein
LNFNREIIMTDRKDKEPAEGSRDIVERELERQEQDAKKARGNNEPGPDK